MQPKILSSKQGRQQLWQAFLQQLGAAAQGAAQLGAAAAQGAGAAQVGPAAAAQGAAAGAAHPGSAAWQQLGAAEAQAGLQAGLQQRLQPTLLKAFSRPGRQQVWQAFLQQLGAAAQGAAHGAGAAQLGAAAAQGAAAGAAHPGSAAWQQLGAAAEQPVLQAGLQQRTFTQRTLQQLVSQQLVSQPQPLTPSIRSRSSKPKLWVQAAMPSTNEAITVFHFIERRLLNDGTIKLAHVPVRPDPYEP